MRPSLRPRRDPAPDRRPVQESLALGSDWEGPTVAEFVQRVEQEFGASPDVGRLLADSRQEPLAPAEIRALCEQIGVPADDFGV